MLFEMGNVINDEVLFVEQDIIDREIRAISSNINEFNNFIVKFNTAHEGMPLEFNETYTKAVLSDRFREVAGGDLTNYIDSSPKFLRQSITDTYTQEIEPIYEEAEILGNRFIKFFYLRANEWGISFDPSLLDIAKNGMVSISTALRELITEKFTGNTSDVNQSFADKLKQYINLENELREMVGNHQNLKNVLASQCPNWTNQDIREYSLVALVRHIKKTGLNINAQQNY